ncbi:hypothetical protein [Streptomyces sp. 1222.5]|uniref:hypothetical protein n=1 Tax=Streptomyces sp. 1222.5 TaxID=1881026 RepID=UPI003D71C5CC
MNPVPVESDCPAALFHPDDLVPETYPGMKLTTAEARQVEEILAPHVAKCLESSETTLNGWLPVLHPIPIDSKERWDWDQARDGLSDKRYIVENERASYQTVMKAYAAGNWTKLLYAFSRPSWSTQAPTDLTKALQPFRNELDKRRKELRLAAARRLGCTCLDDPQAAAEAKTAKAIEYARLTGQNDVAVAALRAKLLAERAEAVVTRRLELPKETAEELDRAAVVLRDQFKLVSHHIMGALMVVALEHLPEVTERLHGVNAARTAKQQQYREPSCAQESTES